jgi:hypothetical protein
VTYLDDFTMKFEKYFALVSFLSTNTYTKLVWYLDSGASRLMIEEHELFIILTKMDSYVHVELGDDAKYVVKGERTVLFQLELGGPLGAQDVLYVPGLKNNWLSVSAMDNKGFYFNFQRGKVLIHPEKDIPNTRMVIGVRNDTSYRFQCKHVRDLVHDSENLCELFHKRLGHLHYMALLILMGIVIGLLEFSIE